MTYFQIMIKTLEFFVKETLDNEYYEFWHLYHTEYIPEWKQQAKLGIMYLLLLQMKNTSNINNNLFKKIEEKLTTYEISLCKTFEKAIETTTEEVIDDPDSSDLLCLINTDDIDSDLRTEIEHELSEIYFDAYRKNISENVQTEILETPLNIIIYAVVTTIAELFFTYKGDKYLSDEYKIEDEKLRQKCYEYVTTKIQDYKFGSNDECFLDEYDSLYYSTKLIYVVLELIKNKQYDKLERLINIDNCLIWEVQINSENNYQTMIEILYDTRNVLELDLQDNAFLPTENDIYLDFFLNNPALNNLFSDVDMALILINFFDNQEPESINQIIDNLEDITRILKSSNTLTHKGKQLKKLKKSIARSQTELRLVKKLTPPKSNKE